MARSRSPHKPRRLAAQSTAGLEALERCRVALSGSPPSTQGAIDAALEAWRATRAPAIADLVDRLSQHRLRELEADAARTSTRKSRAARPPAILLTERALDACKLVVDAELSLLGEDGWDADAPSDDPRFARALVRVMFERATLRDQPEGWVARHAERLEELGDVRMAEPLRAMLTSANAFPGRAAEARARPVCQRALAELERRASALEPLAPELAAVLARIDALAPPPATAAPTVKLNARFLNASAAGALDAVFADPDDDSLRQVCGDRLIEAGDPRGELVALQFAARDGRLDKDGHKRIAALLVKNAGHWSGPIAPIGTRESMRFERGFLAEIALDKSTLGLQREMWDAALETPYWATVERLNVSERVPDWWLRAFLQAPASSRIRELAFRPKGGKTPCVLLARPAGSPPGAHFRLVSATRKETKFVKALVAFSREQLDLLRRDALTRELPPFVHEAIETASSRSKK